MISSTQAQFRRPHNNCYWVIPGQFLAGEYPGAYRPETAHQRLQDYLDVGVTYFLDLTHPNDDLTPYDMILQEVAAESQIVVTYRRLPVYDMSIPSAERMVTILDTIDEALAQNKVVYVHCWGGVGRTGTVVGCHLVRHGFTGEAAFDQLATWWQRVEKAAYHPRSPETDAQVAMIRGWHEGDGSRERRRE